MWWLIPAATAGLNFLQAGEKNRQKDISNKLQSEITRYGYLTNHKCRFHWHTPPHSWQN